MLNSRQRAWLRAQANALDARFQIGKGEVTATLCRSLDEMLTTHELLKVKVLKSAGDQVAGLAVQVAEAVQAELVQQIGRCFVLYRFSDKLAKQGKSLQLPDFRD